jgi:hypothetical protein
MKGEIGLSGFSGRSVVRSRKEDLRVDTAVSGAHEPTRRSGNRLQGNV